jgi:hypothetical protein
VSWLPEELTGAVKAQKGEPMPEPVSMREPVREPSAVQNEMEPIPVARESGVVPAGTGAYLAESWMDPVARAFAPELADLFAWVDEVAVVDELPPLEDDEVAPPDAQEEDPFAQLLRSLGLLADRLGAPRENFDAACTQMASRLDAWGAVLRGERNDFDACGPGMLDDFACELLSETLRASALAPLPASELRRQVRAHGIVAFGLIDAA